MPGCVIYAASGTLFAGFILAAALAFLIARARRKADLAQLDWGARFQHPPTPREQGPRRLGILCLVLAAAVILPGFGIEAFGLRLGLLDAATGCPEGWPLPQVLR